MPRPSKNHANIVPGRPLWEIDPELAERFGRAQAEYDAVRAEVTAVLAREPKPFEDAIVITRLQ